MSDAPSLEERLRIAEFERDRAYGEIHSRVVEAEVATERRTTALNELKRVTELYIASKRAFEEQSRSMNKYFERYKLAEEALVRLTDTKWTDIGERIKYAKDMLKKIRTTFKPPRVKK